jgi:hypothetical protein
LLEFTVTDGLLIAILGVLLMMYRQIGGLQTLMSCAVGSLNEVRTTLGLAPFHGEVR